ncbi:MAG: nodulation protein NolW [Hyphomicrobium sp.]|nr:MAG: nodulation protein NolW [Hyphomicrobium sp.]
MQNSEFSDRNGGERREHLEYLADLLGELQRMAEREGCRKLSRMLAISHAEARRETHRPEN